MSDYTVHHVLMSPRGIHWIQRERFSIFVTQVRSVLSYRRSVDGSSNGTGLLGIDAKSW